MSLPPTLRPLGIAICFALFPLPLSAVPTANPDGYESPEDNELIVDAAAGVLANDVPDGGPLTAILQTGPTNGALALNPDGSFSYQPDENFNGSDSFTYIAESTPAGPFTFTVDQSRSNVDVSATLNASPISQTRSDSSSVTGTALIQLNPPGAPFGEVHIQDFNLVLADAVAFNYNFILITVNVTANGGDIQVGMSQAGPPTNADATGAFTQTNNNLAITGTANVSSSGIDLGVPDGPQSLNTTLQNQTLSGTLSEAGGTITLTLPVVFNGTFNIGTNTVDLNITGTIVATAPAPTSSQSTPATVTIDVDPVDDAPFAQRDTYYIFEGDTLDVPVAAGAGQVLVATGSTWRYLDDGSDQGTAWREAGFDDSAWAQGAAELGYGDGDETTEIGFGGDAENKFVTSYFRRSFELLDLEQTAGLRLRLRRDDGAAVYLNGVEVVRDGLPGGALFDTLASAVAGDAGETTFFEFDIDPAALVQGTNVLAVEIHQATVDSSDLSFDLELLRVPAGGVLANDSDPDGDALASTVVTPPSNGTLNLAADGSFEYTPDPGFAGTDQFVYKVPNGSERVPAELLGAGTSWRYLDDGSDQGTAWRAPGFDDSTWATGPAQLGYGEADEATVVGFGPDASNKFPTTYFRARFTVGDPSQLASLTFNLLRDDAAAIYLNGTEVFRDTNLPAGAAFDTLATSAVDEANAQLAIGIPVGNLVAGENVIAVEVHQATVDTSDLSFALSASGTAPPPTVVMPRGGTWSYLDDGSDQGTAWRATGFDDSAWATGPAPLGYEAGEATTLSFGPDANNKFVTSYFRRTFQATGVAGAVAAVLRLRRDDGAAVYLNGVEITRDNLPAAAPASGFASTTVGDADELTYFEFAFDPTLLNEGDNVLAAEVHQANATSSDLVFDAEVAISVADVQQVAAVTVVGPGTVDPDSDNDGMLDSYELANGLTVGIDDSAGDLDSDGQSNIAESIAGTAANDPTSVLRITDVGEVPVNQLALTVSTVPGKTYRLQTSADGTSWSDVPGSEWTAAAASEVVNVDRADPARLWRAVVVEAPQG